MRLTRRGKKYFCVTDISQAESEGDADCEDGENEYENEVEDFELPPPESQHQVLGSVKQQIQLPDSITWPSKCRRGWPTTIQHTATKLGCDRFLNSLHLFIAKSPSLSHAFRDISKEQLGSLQIGVVEFYKKEI